MTIRSCSSCGMNCRLWRARVSCWPSGASFVHDLKFIFIVSAATVVRDENELVEAMPLGHAKCERCWHVREDVGANAEHVGLCGRCVSNLHGEGEARTCA